MNFLEAMPIKSKLTLTAAVVLLSFLIMFSLVSSYQSTLITLHKLEVSSGRSIGAMLMMKSNDKDLLLKFPAEYFQTINAELKNISAELSATGIDPSVRSDIDNHISTFSKSLDRVIDASGSDSSGSDSSSNSNRATQETIASLDDLNKTLVEAIEARKKSATSNMLIGLVVCLIATLAVLLVVANSIIERAKAVVKYMSVVASGQESIKANKMSINGNDEFAEVSKSLNVFLNKLKTKFSTISQISKQLIESSKRASSVSNSTTNSISKQKSETDLLATAITEMVAASEEIARNTQQAADCAQNAKDVASKSIRVIGNANKAINDLADNVQNSSAVILQVESDSKSIGVVLEVIRGIAEQTNLLALNAAIEAARAGESGRGFAVVADEVRTLAQRTQESTEEIQGSIEKLQSGVNKAVNVMQESTQKASLCVDEIGTTNQALTEISDAANRIFELNAQIAVAFEQQSAVSEEINRNVLNISNLASTAEEGATIVAQTSKELNEISKELDIIVSDYKI